MGATITAPTDPNPPTDYHPDNITEPTVLYCTLPKVPDVIGDASQSNGSSGEEVVKCTAAVGQVMGLTTDGRVLILWTDGSTTHCFPQELYSISDEVTVN